MPGVTRWLTRGKGGVANEFGSMAQRIAVADGGLIRSPCGGRIALSRASPIAGGSFSFRTFIPDPDSLGSMFGLAHLVESKLNKPTVITRDGPISRAENRAMVETLHLDLRPIEKIRWKTGDAIVMVDSQPNTGRHNFESHRRLYAVIDHHETPGDLKNVEFTDVRPTHGATCTW